jgi:hypothetical protein
MKKSKMYWKDSLEEIKSTLKNGGKPVLDKVKHSQKETVKK